MSGLRDIMEIWNQDYSAVGRYHNPVTVFEFNQRVKRVWGKIDVRQGSECLDVGCGGGHFSVAMALAGGNVTAFDINKAYIENRVKPLAARYGVKIKAYACDALGRLPFEGKKFDRIIAIESLEHLRSPEKGIGKLKGLLKENGRLIVTIPNIESLFWRVVKFLEKCHLWKPRDTIGRQVHKEFTESEAFDLVKGFEILKYEKLFSSHLFVLKA